MSIENVRRMLGVFETYVPMQQYATLFFMQCPKVAIFDVDDTLAESFQPPAAPMLEKLEQLLSVMPVAIVSAAGFPRLERDFLSVLSKSKNASQLYVLPNSSAQAYTWQGAWNEEYNLAISEAERENIKTAILADTEDRDPRAMVIDREVQVAYAAIGLECTLEEKKAWDPDQSKRKLLKATLEKQLPDFEVLIGGTTTIDITRKGINKAYGVRWISEKLKIAPSDMLYVGDALYEGGNDAVVIPTGIQTKPVTGPSETEKVIDEMLHICSQG